MFHLLCLLFASSLCFSPIKSSVHLPTDFTNATVQYILLETPTCCFQTNETCKKCIHFNYINQIYSERLYYFAFTIEPEKITHLLKIIHDLKKSIYFSKNDVSLSQIRKILHMSPSEYQEFILPYFISPNASPSQKQRKKGLKRSFEKENLIRNTYNYYALLCALQEAIELLLHPKARALLEQNFVNNEHFNFNSFIQYFGHKQHHSYKKLHIHEKEQSSLYFAKDKYGKHRFYEVKARTLRLFKKILTLYLKEMPHSTFYQKDIPTFSFSEKKRHIQNSLTKAHDLLTSILPNDQLLLEDIATFLPRFHSGDYYKTLLNDDI